MSDDKQFKNAIDAANALRNLIAEARGIRKDLQSDLKKIKEEAQKDIEKYIHGQVTIQLEQLGKQTETAMNKAVARVDAKFQELADLYLKGVDNSKPDLDTLLHDVANKLNRRKKPDPRIPNNFD